MLDGRDLFPPYKGGIKGGVLILILDIGYWMLVKSWMI